MKYYLTIVKHTLLEVWEVLICVLTVLIPPINLLTSNWICSAICWIGELANYVKHTRGEADRNRDEWNYNLKAKQIVCWFWKLHSKLFHGHEIIGRENIPRSGPALIIYYHGALPLDYYYLVADIFYTKKRIVRSIVDKMLESTPGFKSLLKTFECQSGTRESCVEILKNGHILGLSPGGMYEAQMGDNMYKEYTQVWAKIRRDVTYQTYICLYLQFKEEPTYQILKVMWRARDGFARVVKSAGGEIPIIPVFTQNIREAYKSFNVGVSRPFWHWLHETTRLPLVPIYGGVPVKLRTFIGSAIVLPSTATVEQIRSRTLEAMENMIKTHQVTVPGSQLVALSERFI